MIREILSSTFFLFLMLIILNAKAVEIPIMIVSGKVYEADGKTVVSDKITVEVTNITRGLNLKDSTNDAGQGLYVVTFVDFSGKNVAANGDEIKVVVTNVSGEELGKASHALTYLDIREKIAIINIVSNRQPPWDLNGDLRVDISDLAIVGLHFGAVLNRPKAPNPDVNRDGIVDTSDLILVGIHFGESL